MYLLFSFLFSQETGWPIRAPCKNKKMAAHRLDLTRFFLTYEQFAKYREGTNFVPSCRRLRAKKSSASGSAFPPDLLTRALPLDPAGGCAPRPRYRLALRTRHRLPPHPQTLIAGYVEPWFYCTFT